MSPEFTHSLRRHKATLLSGIAVVTLGWAAYSGSTGFRDLLAKREQIRELQEQNAVLESQNADKRTRVERLESNEGEQDIEIRKLNLSKPGETIFMLPDAEKKKPAEPKRKKR
jgi:cell division protein FtsB